MDGASRVTTVDYHTAGEPFRIVLDGVPDIEGSTVLARRETASHDPAIDRVRELLVREPRGHADMYGCFLVPPDDDGADLGVLFWHKDGYSTACGHGTIALGAWAVAQRQGAERAERHDRRGHRRSVGARHRTGHDRRRRGDPGRVQQRRRARHRSRHPGRDQRGGRSPSTSATAARSTRRCRRERRPGRDARASRRPRGPGAPDQVGPQRHAVGRAPPRSPAERGLRHDLVRRPGHGSGRRASISATSPSSPTARWIVRRAGPARRPGWRCSSTRAGSAPGRRCCTTRSSDRGSKDGCSASRPTTW